jgi:hypothetical protein
MAAILTGRAVPRVEGWYPVEACTVTAADGSARTMDAERHPDPLAEAVRRSLVEAELLQAIGRGRGVQRTAGNPLVVLVLGNTPLPVPLASVTDWQPVDPDRAMLADHGAVLASDSDAAEVIGKTRNAVKLARRRLGSCPYVNLLKGHDPNLGAGLESPALPGQGAYLPENLAAVTYQRRGAGRSASRMVYDPRRIADPRGWLEAKLGPLAAYDGPEAPECHREAQAPQAAGFDHLPATQTAFPGERLPGFEFLESIKAPEPGGGEFLDTVNGPSQPARDILTFADMPAGPVETADELQGIAPGILSEGVRALVRARVRASGLRQEEFAQRVGLSRPQVANALQGRFGLSPSAADRLRAVVADLPSLQGAFL